MSACRPYLYMAAGCFTKMHGILYAEKRKPMGKIHNVEKMTDNRFVNLYHVDATSVHNTPVSYYVASRAKDVPALKPQADGKTGFTQVGTGGNPAQHSQTTTNQTAVPTKRWNRWN